MSKKERIEAKYKAWQEAKADLGKSVEKLKKSVKDLVKVHTHKRKIIKKGGKIKSHKDT